MARPSRRDGHWRGPIRFDRAGGPQRFLGRFSRSYAEPGRDCGISTTTRRPEAPTPGPPARRQSPPRRCHPSRPGGRSGAPATRRRQPSGAGACGPSPGGLSGPAGASRGGPVAADPTHRRQVHREQHRALAVRAGLPSSSTIEPGDVPPAAPPARRALDLNEPPHRHLSTSLPYRCCAEDRWTPRASPTSAHEAPALRALATRSTSEASCRRITEAVLRTSARRSYWRRVSRCLGTHRSYHKCRAIPTPKNGSDLRFP